MGVFGLFSKLRDKYRNQFKQLYYQKNIYLQYELDILFIDGNALLYPIAENAEAKDIAGSSLSKYVAMKFAEAIREYHNEFGCMVYVCMDGPAHMAKIKQQRSRRFGYDPIMSIDKVNIDLSEKYSRVIDASVGIPFTPAMFTPGTTIMKEIDEYLTQQFPQNDNSAIKYSSYMEPYEGEHKIFKICRSILDENKDKPLKFAIVGKDADLLLLAMGLIEKYKGRKVTPYIIRHDDRTQEDGYRATDPLYFLDMQEIRTNILTDMKYPDASIWDFVIATFLCGNDFLPPVPEFLHIRETLDIIIHNCKNLYNPSYVKTGYIDWVKFNDFITTIYGKNKVYDKIRREWTVNSDLDQSDPSKFNHVYYETVHPFSVDQGRICNAWYMTAMWNMYYYHDGIDTASVAWQYPMHFSPCLDSLYKYPYKDASVYCNNPFDVVTEKLEPLTPIQALAAVLPLWLHGLLPPNIKLQLFEQDLLKYFPWKFKILGPKEEPVIPVLPYELITQLK